MMAQLGQEFFSLCFTGLMGYQHRFAISLNSVEVSGEVKKDIARKL
jgi:hypothetical protein